MDDKKANQIVSAIECWLVTILILLVTVLLLYLVWIVRLPLGWTWMMVVKLIATVVFLVNFPIPAWKIAMVLLDAEDICFSE
jgi:hypothetical protein